METAPLLPHLLPERAEQRRLSALDKLALRVGERRREIVGAGAGGERENRVFRKEVCAL